MEAEKIIKITSEFSKLISEKKWYVQLGLSKQAGYNLKKRFLNGTVTPKTLEKWVNKYHSKKE
ncbi:MAG: hypothetical protein ACOYCB_07705 [Fastidiosipilaceae bacterium]|jgi:hypothetical protein